MKNLILVPRHTIYHIKMILDFPASTKSEYSKIDSVTFDVKMTTSVIPLSINGAFRN